MPNVAERFVDFRLEWAMAAQLEENIPGRVNNSGSNFQQLQPQRINTVSLHGVGQRESPKPIEQVVGQRVNLHSIGIDNLTGTAHIMHVKAAFALLDEVLHFSAFAVKTDQILRR